MRRATSHQFLCDFYFDISIHALREEGDLVNLEQSTSVDYISIHALREEGDCAVWPQTSGLTISIHALREEGDDRFSQFMP